MRFARRSNRCISIDVDAGLYCNVGLSENGDRIGVKVQGVYSNFSCWLRWITFCFDLHREDMREFLNGGKPSSPWILRL